MFKQVINIAVAAVTVLTAVPVSAQRTQYGAWYHSVSVDDFSDERTESAGSYSGDEVSVIIGCLSNGYPFLMFLMNDGIFHNGEIELRWIGGHQDGEIESYTFDDDNRYISIAPTPGSASLEDMSQFERELEDLRDAISIIYSLKAHSELRVRFRRWPDTRVTDRISLSGSSRAIDALSCWPVNP